jgi:aminoglycoside N3'-acetyltransferase
MSKEMEEAEKRRTALTRVFFCVWGDRKEEKRTRDAECNHTLC